MGHGNLWLFNMEIQKSAVIRSFKDIDECLNWINSESSARDECVEVLNEHC